MDGRRPGTSVAFEVSFLFFVFCFFATSPSFFSSPLFEPFSCSFPFPSRGRWRRHVRVRGDGREIKARWERRTRARERWHRRRRRRRRHQSIRVVLALQLLPAPPLVFSHLEQSRHGSEKMPQRASREEELASFPHRVLLRARTENHRQLISLKKKKCFFLFPVDLAFFLLLSVSPPAPPPHPRPSSLSSRADRNPTGLFHA